MADRPKQPPPPRTPTLPPLRLAPMRSGTSVKLDAQTTQRSKQAVGEVAPFLRWDRFLEEFVWKQGEHLTTIGPTGSGKTVLNRELLKRRDLVVVLGVKNRDPELYGGFQKMGYNLQHTFDPQPPADADEHLVLFVPRVDGKHGQEARQIRTRRFRNALNGIMDVGYWAVYIDDAQYTADQLRLRVEMEEIWILGRSEKVTMVASSQEPVDLPVMAYGQATHLFLFKNTDRRRAQRMAELTRVNREATEMVVMALDDHEFLYVNRSSGRMVRSKVLRRR